MADSKKYNGSTWEHSLRKLTTATDTITTLPVDVYADGNNATVSISGNTVQPGTPTPLNPVAVNGVGNKTANLCSLNKTGYYVDNRGNEQPLSGFNLYKADVSGSTEYTLNAEYSSSGATTLRCCEYDNTGTFISVLVVANLNTVPKTFTTSANAKYIKFSCSNVAYDIMLNIGSTALPYEPYGYKIPILINKTITNIYIGDNPLRKSLDGTAYDTLAADGTLTQRVDSDGSVLATPIVTQITMPTFTLADGANTVSVDTTVQPSEMAMTYRGWHDASVKEWDGSQWNE